MKGFYWGSGAVRCSYCANRGHNITTCKLINRDAGAALHKMQLDASYICSPHEHAALVEMKRREERKNKIRKPRRASRCSYCKSYDHKRPSCQLLKDFKQKVYQANKNWKRLFVEKASEVGVGIGALIQFDNKTVHSLDFNVDAHRIAMIASYDLSNLNVFCALNDYSDYQSNATLQILSGERHDNVSVKHMSRLIGNELLHEGWWYSSSQPIVLSPMKFVANSDWLNAEWDEVLNWFFKKVTTEELNDDGLMDFIETWANKV
jgi:hypothetical protein